MLSHKQLLLISYFLPPLLMISAVKYNYPVGILPCKFHNQTQLDCSHRYLTSIPPFQISSITHLDLHHNKLNNISGVAYFHLLKSLQYLNLTKSQITSLDSITFSGLSSLTILDLSRNYLQSITGAPFQELTALQLLKLNSNDYNSGGIYNLSSSVFRGLHNLETLHLYQNGLRVLQDDIFVDLINLKHLNFTQNSIHEPCNAMAPLQSLQTLNMSWNRIRSLRLGECFQNLTNLVELDAIGDYISDTVGNSTFQYFTNVPLKHLSISLWLESQIYSGVFAPLTGLRYLEIDQSYQSLSQCMEKLTSLNSSIEHLVLRFGCCDSSLNLSSFEPLARWGSSLTILEIIESSLIQIEDGAFSLFPELRKLVLRRNELKEFSEYAFHGLNKLEILDLSNNDIEKIPYGALEVFSKYGNLKYLDLSNNQITGDKDENAIDMDNFAENSSLSHLYLAMNNIGGLTCRLCHINLVKLDIDYTVVRNAFTIVVNMPVLKTISLAQKQHSHHSDASSKRLVVYEFCHQAPAIEEITFSEWDVKFPIAELLGVNCSKLRVLDLSATNFMEQDPQSDVYFPRMTSLKMSHNDISSLAQLNFIEAPSLQVLDLSDNVIAIINDTKLLTNLRHFNLENNRIIYINWLHHLPMLQYLNLAHNSFSFVPKELLHRKSPLVALDLSDNPYDCSQCDLAPFQDWIIHDTITMLEADPPGYQCKSPDADDRASVTSADLSYCPYLVLIYVGSTIVSVLILGIIVAVTIKYRWHIKYKLFLMCHNYQRELDDDDEEVEENQNERRDLLHAPVYYRRYDAYVIFAKEDADWIDNELVYNLENHEDRFKLCIKDRGDIPAGHFLLNAICHGIKHSKRTIVVLSENFVGDGLCNFQLQIAQMRLIEERRDVLILVGLTDVPDRKKTMLLRQILCRSECMDWPQDNAGQYLFWRRLKEELKRPVRVDPRFEI